MIITNDNNFNWNPRCRANILIVATVIGLIVYMVFTVGIEEVNAQELHTSSYGSKEARLRLLELIAEGKLSEPGIEKKIIQSSDGQQFLIRTVAIDSLLQIQLIPEIEDNFKFPSIASWGLLFDRNQELTEVRYYYQTNEFSYIKAISYLSNTEFTLVINNNVIYTNISTPISIRNFLKMPIKQFIHETQQILYLDSIFPNKRFMNINEKSRNFTNYLKNSFSRDKHLLLYQNGELDSMAVPDSMISKQRASNKTLENKETIIFTVNYILEYINSKHIDESQFTLVDSNNNLVPLYDKRYLSMYAESITKFLKLLPGLYTSASVLSTPFKINDKKSLEYLYTKIFLMTARFPGVWYLVPIFQEIPNDEQTVAEIVSLHILIPYFNYDGSFEIYGWDKVDTIITESQSLNTVKYFFNAEILRVPNKQLKYFE